MNRSKFMLTSLALLPITVLAKVKNFVLTRADKGFKVNAGEARTGEHIKMRGITMNVLDVKISGKDTDGAVAVFEQTGFMYKSGPPMHVHLFQDEYFYILEGEYLFQVGDDKYSMKAGDTIFLPRNVPHGFVQLTEKARVIVSMQPAGKMEEFFKRTASLTAQPSTQEVAKLLEEYDMKLVGPPMKAE